MILQIQKGENNPILRKKSEDVLTITPDIKRLILDMKETVNYVQGVGLAAPQIGKNIKIFVINRKLIRYLEKKNKFSFLGLGRKNIPEVFINPKMINLSKKKEFMNEGCLSLPGIFGLVERRKKAEIEALDENSKRFKLKIDGLLAQVFQHETDHLNGILFIDKAIRIQDLNNAKGEK